MIVTGNKLNKLPSNCVQVLSNSNATKINTVNNDEET